MALCNKTVYRASLILCKRGQFVLLGLDSSDLAIFEVNNDGPVSTAFLLAPHNTRGPDEQFLS